MHISQITNNKLFEFANFVSCFDNFTNLKMLFQDVCAMQKKCCEKNIKNWARNDGTKSEYRICNPMRIKVCRWPSFHLSIQILKLFYWFLTFFNQNQILNERKIFFTVFTFSCDFLFVISWSQRWKKKTKRIHKHHTQSVWKLFEKIFEKRLNDTQMKINDNKCRKIVCCYCDLSEKENIIFETIWPEY